MVIGVDMLRTEGSSSGSVVVPSRSWDVGREEGVMVVALAGIESRCCGTVMGVLVEACG